MKLLSDTEIHDAVMVGYDKKVIADNLTDEIELKRHEVVKEAIRRQAELTANEKDAEWRLALEIAHQQDEEHWHDVYKEKLAEIDKKKRKLVDYLSCQSGIHKSICKGIIEGILKIIKESEAKK